MGRGIVRLSLKLIVLKPGAGWIGWKTGEDWRRQAAWLPKAGHLALLNIDQTVELAACISNGSFLCFFLKALDDLL